MAHQDKRLCPNCLKWFKNEKAVLQHLNQPRSRCHGGAVGTANMVFQQQRQHEHADGHQAYSGADSDTDTVDNNSLNPYDVPMDVDRNDSDSDDEAMQTDSESSALSNGAGRLPDSYTGGAASDVEMADFDYASNAHYENTAASLTYLPFYNDSESYPQHNLVIPDSVYTSDMDSDQEANAPPTDLPFYSKSHPEQNRFIEKHPNCSGVAPGGETFTGKFEGATFSKERKDNLYYPFASDEEWELAAFLLQSKLSLADLTTLLSLKLVCL